jgi:Zinc carboxypeptidase
MRATGFAATCSVLSILTLAPVASAQALPQSRVPTPEAFLGTKPGTDRYLAPWPQVVAYLQAVDAASGRVAIESAGTSTLGHDLPVVIVTAEKNHPHLERYRQIARRLAQPDGLTAAATEELVAEGKAIVLVTCSIHSTEVGSTQMAMELVHELATTEDARTRGWLDEVILLLMPSINPDGQVMVVDWYNRHLGSQFEGGAMPWLYHHYVGHDNNRDFAMLTQKETRAVNDVLYQRWFPQVFLDEHQMGSTGPRMFVPPQADPLAPEVDSLVFRTADLLGTMMSLRLEEAGKTGVGHDMIFDSYWPGGTRNTAWWKNVVGLLTEVASARIATPITIEAGELEGEEKGLPEYQRRSNFPSPWPGGSWRLRDIMDYELVATRALLETVASHRAGVLRNTARMAATAIAAGSNESPSAFVVPPEQHDPVAAARMIELLLRHGVRVERAEQAFTAGRQSFAAGSYVLRAAQPYRSFLLTMLRPQRYPEVTPYVGGPIYPPYDVTSWSLPINMGVETIEVAEPLPASGLQPIAAPVWPGGAVAPAAGGYLLSHAADSAVTAVARLLAAKKEVYWLAGPAPDGSPPGEIFIPAAAIPAAELESLVADLHLPVRSLSALPVGPAHRLRAIRVGLVKPWVASMDEGWTRFLLERYEVPLVNLSNQDFLAGKTFDPGVDVILLPDVEAAILKDGKPGEEAGRRWTPLPPPYAGGIGKEGGERLAAWVRAGGTLVALDSSSEYAIELLELPATNVLAKVKEDRFNCPGSMLRVLVDPAQPLGYGLRAEEAAYFASSPAFETRLPDARFERRVAVRYPDDEKDMLESGYLKGGNLLERRAAVVEFTVGKGRVVLLGLRVQHRAQPHRTFKLLWNALFLAAAEAATL